MTSDVRISMLRVVPPLQPVQNGDCVVIDRSQADALAGALETWVAPDEPLESRIVAALPGDSESYISVFELEDRLGDVDPEAVAAALARRLAERVADGNSFVGAVVGVVEETKTASVTFVPIGELNDVHRHEASVAGRIEQRWTPSHPTIQQVGWWRPLLDPRNSRSGRIVGRRS